MKWLLRVWMILVSVWLMAVPAQAIDLQWHDTDNKLHTLSDYRGKTVLLHFWASWCPPCRSEMPEMVAWKSAHPDVPLIALSLDSNIDRAARFLKGEGLNEVALLAEERDAAAIGLRALPTTLVINAQGEIVRLFAGAQNWQNAAFNESLLAEFSEAR